MQKSDRNGPSYTVRRSQCGIPLVFRHSIVVLSRLNAQNHFFIPYQVGSFQGPVTENLAPECLVQKRQFLIHVTGKSWLQAALDPRGAQTRSRTAGFWTALSILLASCPALALLLYPLCARGRERAPPAGTAPAASGRKESAFFSLSQVLSEHP